MFDELEIGALRFEGMYLDVLEINAPEISGAYKMPSGLRSAFRTI